jgi:hypothetical protein
MNDLNLSTSTIARKNNISPKDLFNYLIRNNYLVKNNSNYELTPRSEEIGGNVMLKKTYRFIIWNEDLFNKFVISRIKSDSKNEYSYPQTFSSILNQFAIKISDEVWESLDRGKAILKSIDQLNQYLYSYGKCHHKKLKDAYKHLILDLEGNPSFNSSTKIEIIDYGCGQGIASIVLLNELMNIQFPVDKISKVVLIEPSKLALERANILLKQSTKINRINKYLDDLNDADILTDDKAIKIHLFSNILDMADEGKFKANFSIERLTKIIKASQSNENYFVCVGVRKEENINQFAESMMNTCCGEISFISSNNRKIQRGPYGQLNPWFRVHKIFKGHF